MLVAAQEVAALVGAGMEAIPGMQLLAHLIPEAAAVVELIFLAQQ